MPHLLVLDHHGPSVPALLRALSDAGARIEVMQTSELSVSSLEGFDGVVASGGYLKRETFRSDLSLYSQLLTRLDRPYLGVCLGLKILGHCYGARMRRVSLVNGTSSIRFFDQDFALLRGVRDCEVYQAHRYELLTPLPEEMENFAAGGSPVQAVKIRNMDRYGVQFHPELSGEPAIGVLRAFVSICSRSSQGT